jgi:hypothetical protein
MVPSKDAGGPELPPPDELAATVTALYAGPLDGFVAARDALARALRQAKRRDEADEIKSLRKPERLAWALDLVTAVDPDAIEELAGAAAAVASGDDVRSAMARLRTASVAVARRAAAEAADAGQRIDQAEVGRAVLDVVGDDEALAQLREGLLVALPSAGGFGSFAPADAAGPQRATTRTPKAHAKSAATKSPGRAKAAPPKRPAAKRAPGPAEPARSQQARAEARRALKEARAQAAAAERAVRDAAQAVGRAEAAHRSATVKLAAAEEEAGRTEQALADARRAEGDALAEADAARQAVDELESG